jgi:hypothetical protein
MQKITILLVILTMSTLAKGQYAFQRKDLFISGGMSLGNYRTFSYQASERYGNTVPLSLTAEYGLSNKFSAGPFGGYYSRKYKYIGPVSEDTGDDFTYKSHYTVVGLRGTYHFTPQLEDKMKADLTSEDLDLYLSVLAGYEINSLSGTNGMNMEDKSRPVIGVVAGVRYFINYRIALFGEVGPGILGIGSFGVTARF